MALPLYLAMTASEIFCAAELPPKCAYMACHFSPYGTGLSNFPQALPKGSLLIVNDRTPVLGHDPALIAAQLSETVAEWEADGVLLDFQRPGSALTAQIAESILTALSCPVCVSEHYARELNCPVFLPPCPLNRPLTDYIAPWQGRELWLEAALDTQVITVTPTGSRISQDCTARDNPFLHEELLLHCHYSIETDDDQIRFTLNRTEEDLSALLQEAEALNIRRAVGLYQELGALTYDPATNSTAPAAK